MHVPCVEMTSPADQRKISARRDSMRLALPLGEIEILSAARKELSVQAWLSLMGLNTTPWLSASLTGFRTHTRDLLHPVTDSEPHSLQQDEGSLMPLSRVALRCRACYGFQAHGHERAHKFGKQELQTASFPAQLATTQKLLEHICDGSLEASGSF